MPDTYRGSGAGKRLRAILLHIPYFSIEGTVRLAVACRVAPSTISRVLRGRVRPDIALRKAIARAISYRNREAIPVREIFPQVGDSLTLSVCELMGCRGCLPPEAWDEERDILRDTWRGAKPGLWSRSKGMFYTPQKTGIRSRRQARSRAGHITVS